MEKDTTGNVMTTATAVNINNLHQQTVTNDMTINSAKTVVMHINLGATTNTSTLAITLVPDTLKVVRNANLLGINIKDSFTWRAEVSLSISDVSLPFK